MLLHQARTQLEQVAGARVAEQRGDRVTERQERRGLRLERVVVEHRVGLALRSGVVLVGRRALAKQRHRAKQRCGQVGRLALLRRCQRGQIAYQRGSQRLRAVEGLPERLAVARQSAARGVARPVGNRQRGKGRSERTARSLAVDGEAESVHVLEAVVVRVRHGSGEQGQTPLVATDQPVRRCVLFQRRVAVRAERVQKLGGRARPADDARRELAHRAVGGGRIGRAHLQRGGVHQRLELGIGRTRRRARIGRIASTARSAEAPRGSAPSASGTRAPRAAARGRSRTADSLCGQPGAPTRAPPPETRAASRPDFRGRPSRRAACPRCTACGCPP